MKNLISMTKERAFFLGLLFLGVNATTSYQLYQVNSYKIFLVAAGISILAVLFEIFSSPSFRQKSPLLLWGVLALPLLATFPGYLFHQGKFNYNFDYELVSNLILILWAGYLYRSIATERAASIFLGMVAFTVLYASIWGITAYYGWNPWDYLTYDSGTIRSTFGNRNYFSGFLIQLLPLLFCLSIPESLLKIEKGKPFSFRFQEIPKVKLYFFTCFFFGTLILFMAQSRAAIAAWVGSLFLVIFLYGISIAPKKIRSIILILIGIGVVLSVASIFGLFLFKDQLKDSRYAILFSIEGWYGRFLPWKVAIESIKASPWIGYGLGSSYNLFFQYVSPESRLFTTERSYNHAHSEYFEYMQEGGLLGALILVLFWAFILWRLFLTIRKESTSNMNRLIALGIIGGIAAYLFQCFFSVAPRMMVVKLPLYTLLALVFVYFDLTHKKEEKKKTETASRNSQLFPAVGALLIVLIVWVLYVPWMKGQYGFVKVQQSPPSIVNVKKLEELTKKRHDIYALSYLAHQNLRYKQPQQLAETIRRMDATIPHYRNTENIKMRLALMQRDIRKARAIGIASQQKDRYYVPTISILMHIAVLQRDRALFYKQMELLTRYFLFKKEIAVKMKENQVKIVPRSMEAPFDIRVSENSVIFEWNEKIVEQLFQSAAKVRIDQATTKEERQSFFNFFSSAFSSHSFFNIKINKGDRKDILNRTNLYFNAVKELERKSQRDTANYHQKLRTTSRKNRARLEWERQKTRPAFNAKINQDVSIHASYLQERTNWNEFLKRKNFAEEFMRELSKTLYFR